MLKKSRVFRFRSNDRSNNRSKEERIEESICNVSALLITVFSLDLTDRKKTPRRINFREHSRRFHIPLKLFQQSIGKMSVLVFGAVVFIDQLQYIHIREHRYLYLVLLFCLPFIYHPPLYPFLRNITFYTCGTFSTADCLPLYV